MSIILFPIRAAWTIAKLTFYVAFVLTFVLLFLSVTAWLIPAWPLWLATVAVPIRFAITTWKLMF